MNLFVVPIIADAMNLDAYNLLSYLDDDTPPHVADEIISEVLEEMPQSQ